MRRPHRSRLVTLAAISALLTTGCSGGNPAPPVVVTATSAMATTPAATPAETSPSAAPEPQAVGPLAEAPLPQDDPVDAAPFPADLAPDTSDVSTDARLSAVNLRFGVHDGFDRIVLDLAGTGQPGWLSAYVDDPTAQGSGAPITLAGAASLQTTVIGVVYPNEEGAQPYVGPQRFQPTSAGVVKEVVYGAVYEGQLELYIGVSSEQPFRVFSLTDPTRLVIDIYHP